MMQSSLFRSTTVATLTLSMALLQPVTGFAQEAKPVLLCEDASKPPCPEGVRLLDEAETKALRKARKAAAAELAAAEQVAAEAVAAEQAAAELAAAEALAAEQAAAEAAAAEQAASEAAAADKVAAEGAAAELAAAAEQAAAEAAAAEQAAVEAAAAADAAAAELAAVEAAAAAETAAAEAAAAEAAAAEAAAAEAAEATAAEATAAEAEAAAAAAEAETAAAAEAAAAEQAAAEQAAAAAAAAAAEPEPATDTATDPVDLQAVEPDATTETPVSPDEVLPELPSGEATVEDIAAEPLPTQVEDLPPVDEPLPEAVAGAIAAATGETEPLPGAEEPVTTTVTEEDVRTSDQDFETAVSAAPAPEAKPRLTDLEKFGLVALGAVVVGAIINNNRVVANSGDRVVVQRDDGQYVVLKDDDALLRQPGSTVQTQTFADGSTLTTMSRLDGSKIITIRDAEGRVLRRALQHPDGTQTLLIDDTRPVKQVDLATLPKPRNNFIADATDRVALAAALADLDLAGTSQRFSLRQIREIREVRELAPQIDLNAITFATGSAAVRPDQAAKLSELGRALSALIDDNPAEVFLVEGHTDATGKAAFNLALSDRRAESVALVLTEYFGVPPENLVVQGYGEAFLKIRTLEAEQLNRRVAVRRITDLMRMASR